MFIQSKQIINHEVCVFMLHIRPSIQKSINHSTKSRIMYECYSIFSNLFHSTSSTRITNVQFHLVYDKSKFCQFVSTETSFEKDMIPSYSQKSVHNTNQQNINYKRYLTPFTNSAYSYPYAPIHLIEVQAY